MSTKFQGKVIALTGAASGIGLATTKLLAERGAILSVADVQAGPLEELVQEIKSTGGTITGTVVDVSNRAAVEEWIKSTLATHGKLDGAANLAGVAGRQAGIATLEEIDDDDFNFIQRVNVKGVLNCLRAEIIAMKEAGKGGSIVNAASICGWRGLMRGGSYNTSKHAVVGLTRSAAVEQGPNQIRVNCIAPGLIETPMTDKLKENIAEARKAGAPAAPDILGTIPFRRVGQASEVAELICWLLCDGSSYISGTVQSTDGGWAAL